jgi:hypothetical protein
MGAPREPVDGCGCLIVIFVAAFVATLFGLAAFVILGGRVAH